MEIIGSSFWSVELEILPGYIRWKLCDEKCLAGDVAFLADVVTLGGLSLVAGTFNADVTVSDWSRDIFSLTSHALIGWNTLSAIRHTAQCVFRGKLSVIRSLQSTHPSKTTLQIKDLSLPQHKAWPHIFLGFSHNFSASHSHELTFLSFTRALPLLLGLPLLVRGSDHPHSLMTIERAKVTQEGNLRGMATDSHPKSYPKVLDFGNQIILGTRIIEVF
ncbi:hypothetical protein Syun_028087 [Stephania yunnanensis]|uniref:Uncharacterized protein n=1 Tax=Stephania yunnanensis TaxID=152371 RepID=A0AAP0EGQ1_9MAGN